MSNESIRVVVVDDHSMVRGGLRLFLIAFDDMTLGGEAANGLEALRVCEQVTPDIVLMDLIMPVMDGIRATREVLARFPGVRVIGMTSFLETDLIVEAMQSGMSGLLSKDVSASEMVQAIRGVRAGQTVLSPQITSLLEQAAARPPAPQPDVTAKPAEAGSEGSEAPAYALTARELEVLSLMVSGASNAEIAQQLVVSLSTAKYHVSSILEKLHVANRAEAVSLALQHRLVEARHAPGDAGKQTGTA